jgi:hypothetical protein
LRLTETSSDWDLLMAWMEVLSEPSGDVEDSDEDDEEDEP